MARGARRHIFFLTVDDVGVVISEMVGTKTERGARGDIFFLRVDVGVVGG